MILFGSEWELLQRSFASGQETLAFRWIVARNLLRHQRVRPRLGHPTQLS